MTVARHRTLVLAVWILLLLGAAVARPVLDARLGAPDISVRGSGAARAEQTMAEHFPALGAEQDLVVFRSEHHRVDDPTYRRMVARVLDTVRGRPGVTAVTSPYDAAEDGRISADRHMAVAPIGTGGDTATRARLAEEVQQRIGRVTAGGRVEAYLVGSTPLSNDLADGQLRDQSVSEAIGIPIALAILLLALGALVAAVLPVALALASVLLCMGVLTPLAGPLHLDRLVAVITTMIGTGIGIDYALFVVSRFREELAMRAGRGRAGRQATDEAVGAALYTSGTTIAASGLVVIVALGSMVVIGGHIFLEIAVASGLVVACSVTAGLTLLPALLATLGYRVNAGKVPRPLLAHRAGSGRWAAWAHFVLRRPLLLGLPALLLLSALALPAASMRLGFDVGFDSLDDAPSGRGQQILTTSFTPGESAPVHIVGCTRRARLGAADLRAFARVGTTLRADERVARVTPVGGAPARRAVAPVRSDTVAEPSVSPSPPADIAPDGRCAHVGATLAGPIDSAGARALVSELRDRLVPTAFAGSDVEVFVGGLTAQQSDFADEVTGKLPLVVAITLTLSFCYLLALFRSLLLPLKAVLLNVLATVAALGLTTLVFQDGHGSGPLGFTPPGALQAYLPVALFALLFGLSMDYEVFLVRRTQEEWLRTGDNAQAVALGLERTAGQITAGAAIMAAVFGSFLFAEVLELKEFGFALTVAVLLDATVVRVVLVPAVMAIGGDANWRLPGFVRRLNSYLSVYLVKTPADASTKDRVEEPGDNSINETVQAGSRS
ncbi:MMPL family transporter [Streptomyces sp. NPDC058989]|uniref:MMPL family transporter n=1 Tax=Streptomyces sp. NPDC058989 TaxID=3346686 RepID=UPI00368C4B8C